MFLFISDLDISQKERYLYLIFLIAIMAAVKITNMLKFYTLCLLGTGPKHGYELIKEIEEKLERKVSASNVYPFLDALRKNNLVRIEKIGKRDKKVYHLTQEGRNFSKRMFSKFGDLITISIQPRLTVCPCGCKVYSGGHKEKINGKLMTFCCSHCAEEFAKIKGKALSSIFSGLV